MRGRHHKSTPGQLRDYTPKEIYEFGEQDVEKFTKSRPPRTLRQAW